MKLFSEKRVFEFRWHGNSFTAENAEKLEPARYLTGYEPLKRAVGCDPLGTTTFPAALEAIRLLLPGPNIRQRHIIVLAGSEFARSSDLDLVAKAAIANKVAVHAIVPGEPQQAVEKFCRQTGGVTVCAPTPADLADSYEQLYLALIDRYEIRYRMPLQAVSLEAKLEIFSLNGWGATRVNFASTAH